MADLLGITADLSQMDVDYNSTLKKGGRIYVLGLSPKDQRFVTLLLSTDVCETRLLRSGDAVGFLLADGFFVDGLHKLEDEVFGEIEAASFFDAILNDFLPTVRL